MAQHGGYRKPEHPAPVSGPGALSRRTDGGPADPHAMVRDIPNAHYGEQQAFHAAESAGPMVQQGPSAIPLDAPSQNPGQPVTAGAAAGPGPGPGAAGIAPSMPQADLTSLRPLIPGIEALASMPDSTPSLRAFARALLSLEAGT